jgi:two-component system response regulator AtoC
VLTDRLEICKDELPEEVGTGSVAGGDVWPMDSISLKANTKVLEKTLIQKALRETDNNRTRAAKLLEISYPTLLSKMKAYEIS